MQTLQEHYMDDPIAKTLLTELGLVSPNEQGYCLSQGIMNFHNRVWIGNNVLDQRHILQAMHRSALGGHSGINAIYHKIKSLFAWPHLKSTATEYVQACQVCQQAKSEHVKLPGLLQPLLVPEQAWSSISMDFIEGLPKSGSFDAILVVIDCFTKYSPFIPLSHPYTTLQDAQLYLNQVYKLPGLPSSIVSNRDRIFTSRIWQELFRL